MLCFEPDGTVLCFEYRFVHCLTTHISDGAADAEKMYWAAVQLARPTPSGEHGQVNMPGAADPVSDRAVEIETLIKTMDIIRSNPPDFYRNQDRISRALPGEVTAFSSALQHLFDILPSACSVRGDLMSIALNTAGIPVTFVGKADSVEEIMWIISQFVLANNDAAPLLGSNGESKGLISWVPAELTC